MTSIKRNPAVLAGTNRAEIDTSTVSTADDTATGLSPQAKWDAANPKAKWAHAALRSAIRKGLIERGPCEVCGAVHGVNDAIVDGHHDPDRYDEPLRVKWLCRLHHRQYHVAEKAGGDHE